MLTSSVASAQPPLVRAIVALLGVVLTGCGQATDGQECEPAGACETSPSCDTNPGAPECGPAVQLLDLPDGFPYCFPSDASADGAVIVGACSNGEITRSVRWERSGGATLLDIDGYTVANAVSADGNVTVGALGLLGDAGYRHDITSRELVLVDQISVPLEDASDDGAVVVGTTFEEPNDLTTAYAVRGDVNALERLAPLATRQPTVVYGVSGDGRVSVGYVHDADGETHAAFWSGDGLHLLEEFPGTVHSLAESANRDGSVIVGTVYLDSAAGLSYPVRWTEAGIERLGDDYGFGGEVSADGRRILVQHMPPEVYESIWEAGVTRNIPDWLSRADFGPESQGPPGGFGVVGITRDGRSAFGILSADETNRAFILRLPE